uniref:Reverse transcriptase/retrotransposon-derived protein RNase H-like domain-containing protein n=1 Tax=Cyprinus carpio carpio TaxID=630221 RepID=A0A9J8D497_CYPCA
MDCLSRRRNAFFMHSLFLFLGHIISTEGVRMDPEKVKAVVNWPSPESRKALQRFLGFANFYRRFIRNFSQLAAPLTALTSPSLTFRWSNAAEAAFAKLKSCFVSAPILVTPDRSRQFIVEVDASEVGVGAVLSQRASSDGKILIHVSASQLDYRLPCSCSGLCSCCRLRVSVPVCSWFHPSTAFTFTTDFTISTSHATVDLLSPLPTYWTLLSINFL